MHGVAVRIVDAVDAELLVELGPECRVAPVEGFDQSARPFDEVSHLLGREPVGGGASPGAALQRWPGWR
jgi:hypothetical protein